MWIGPSRANPLFMGQMRRDSICIVIPNSCFDSINNIFIKHATISCVVILSCFVPYISQNLNLTSIQNLK